MNLIASQRAMRDLLLAPADPDVTSAPGQFVYRNAYRERLLDTLRSRFEMTCAWTGSDSFDAAARHHIILHPPGSWTLDAYGATFPDTLAGLFGDNPEVAELAWLEWHMAQAFAAADVAPAAIGELAAVPEQQWAAAQFLLAPGVAIRPVGTDCASLFVALRDGEMPARCDRLDAPGGLLVWRKRLTPQFRVFEAVEHDALAALLAGRTFGEICARIEEARTPDAVIATIGSLLGTWLADGLIGEIRFDGAGKR